MLSNDEINELRKTVLRSEIFNGTNTALSLLDLVRYVDVADTHQNRVVLAKFDNQTIFPLHYFNETVTSYSSIELRDRKGYLRTLEKYRAEFENLYQSGKDLNYIHGTHQGKFRMFRLSDEAFNFFVIERAVTAMSFYEGLGTFKKSQNVLVRARYTHIWNQVIALFKKGVTVKMLWEDTEKYVNDVNDVKHLLVVAYGHVPSIVDGSLRDMLNIDQSVQRIPRHLLSTLVAHCVDMEAWGLFENAVRTYYKAEADDRDEQVALFLKDAALDYIYSNAGRRLGTDILTSLTTLDEAYRLVKQQGKGKKHNDDLHRIVVKYRKTHDLWNVPDSWVHEILS